MTQVHFTLKSEEIQSIIEYSVKDDVSKNILTTVFNQLMENQRTEYIQAKEYERTENRQSQRNGYYERSFTTRVGTLELKVPRTRDGHFSPTVFERYQRNEKALMASMLEMYVSGVSTRKVSKIVEELCGKSVSKSFVSSLTEQLQHHFVWKMCFINSNASSFYFCIFACFNGLIFGNHFFFWCCRCFLFCTFFF